jgi:hypothetical protein
MRRLGTIRGFSRHARLTIAGALAASLGVLGCGSSGGSTATSAHTASSPAAAAAVIAPASLIAPAADMQGFSASGPPQTATSARRWAEASNEADEVAHETARLTREGFQEGVGQHYKGAAGSAAISLALVFSSAEGTRKEVTHYLEEDPHYGLHVEGVKVAAIPGATVVGEGPAGNVFFTSGRCFLLVGDDLGSSGGQAQANAVPIAAATALYGQVKRSCA